MLCGCILMVKGPLLLLTLGNCTELSSGEEGEMEGLHSIKYPYASEKESLRIPLCSALLEGKNIINILIRNSPISFISPFINTPFPSPGDLPDLGIEPVSPALAGRFFITKPLGK